MFSWSSQAEEVLEVRESVPRQVDKKPRGSWGERGLEFSRRRKGQTSFFSTFLSLSHLKHLFFFLSLGPELMITQLSLNSVKESEVARSCLTLYNPVDCSLPGSSIHGIFQARVLECIAISFSRGSSQPRDPAQVSHIVGRCLTIWAT